MADFKFALGQQAKIQISGESGTVIARGDSLTGERAYHVRYRNAAGCAVEVWWPESALEPADGCGQ